MSTVAVTRLIEAPVVEVWRVFTDLPSRCTWLSTVTRVEASSIAARRAVRSVSAARTWIANAP